MRCVLAEVFFVVPKQKSFLLLPKVLRSHFFLMQDHWLEYNISLCISPRGTPINELDYYKKVPLSLGQAKAARCQLCVDWFLNPLSLLVVQWPLLL